MTPTSIILQNRMIRISQKERLDQHQVPKYGLALSPTHCSHHLTIRYIPKEIITSKSLIHGQFKFGPSYY
jgi:hypothetical protein